jgi:hypothetical protein
MTNDFDYGGRADAQGCAHWRTVALPDGMTCARCDMAVGPPPGQAQRARNLDAVRRIRTDLKASMTWTAGPDGRYPACPCETPERGAHPMCRRCGMSALPFLLGRSA